MEKLYSKQEIESQKLCYRFQACFDERVNPPGQEGNVELYITPNKSSKILVIKLNI